MLKRCMGMICILGIVLTVMPVAWGNDGPAILGLKERAALFDTWLQTRLDTLLPKLMRKEGIDLWLVMCEEYNEDPVYLSLVPFNSLSARRLSILAFFDGGKEEGIERFSVSRYGVEGLYETVWNAEKEDQWDCLARAIKERNPQRIGINESRTFAFGDGLTASLKKELVRALGPEISKRLVPADRLAVGWLERRLPEELEVYPHIVSLAHAIISEAFSSRVITPGVTIPEDVEWWMWEKIVSLGLTTWFNPSVSIQRSKLSAPRNPDVIHRGDLLHCDFGITYLMLNTDTQQHAYVLREGEDDAPSGLKAALAEGNRLQDILMGEFREGRTGNEILALALKKARDEGLMPSIYTHPLGFHGHGAGPTIGLWDKQDGVPGSGDYPLFFDTVYSIELNVRSSVPEWGNQEIRIALEQDAAFTRAGTYFLDRRQTAFHLIE